jgi:hypothetical protein
MAVRIRANLRVTREAIAALNESENRQLDAQLEQVLLCVREIHRALGLG